MLSDSDDSGGTARAICGLSKMLPPNCTLHEDTVVRISSITKTPRETCSPSAFGGDRPTGQGGPGSVAPVRRHGGLIGFPQRELPLMREGTRRDIAHSGKPIAFSSRGFMGRGRGHLANCSTSGRGQLRSQDGAQARRDRGAARPVERIPTRVTSRAGRGRARGPPAHVPCPDPRGVRGCG